MPKEIKSRSKPTAKSYENHLKRGSRVRKPSSNKKEVEEADALVASGGGGGGGGGDQGPIIKQETKREVGEVDEVGEVGDVVDLIPSTSGGSGPDSDDHDNVRRSEWRKNLIKVHGLNDNGAWKILLYMHDEAHDTTGLFDEEGMDYAIRLLQSTCRAMELPKAIINTVVCAPVDYDLENKHRLPQGHIYDEPRGAAQVAWVACVPEVSVKQVDAIRKLMSANNGVFDTDTAIYSRKIDRHMTVQSIELDAVARCIIVYGYCGEQID